MLKFLKKGHNKTDKPTLFARLKAGLSKTRHQLTEDLATFALGKKELDDALIEEIETRLLMADVGAETTAKVIENLPQHLKRKHLDDSNRVINALKEVLTDLLLPVEKALLLPDKKPAMILMVGVNGSGKTTTIGKLAAQFNLTGVTRKDEMRGKSEQKTGVYAEINEDFEQAFNKADRFSRQSSHKIMLAAGDTFRAAAIEQLQVWGARHHIPVIAQQAGSDSASVIFDALQSAKAKQFDLLIADTAGRLHTQSHLMEELKKIVRVIKKIDETAPHETLLVLDASIGQNALQQAKQFHETIGISGIVITKLDGTAKGGIIFTIAEQLKLPIYFIGVGESAEDLQPFQAKTFINALFA